LGDYAPALVSLYDPEKYEAPSDSIVQLVLHNGVSGFGGGAGGGAAAVAPIETAPFHPACFANVDKPPPS
jgi:hypothetical protein